MSNTKKIDMTKGPIIRNILLFAIPIIIGNILQQLYTTVDTLVIGNYCGSTSLAAVGTSAQPVEVMLCIFLGVGTGVSILVSQYMGSGKTEDLEKLCDTAVSFVFMVGIPLIALGYIFTPFILRAMGVPADTWDYANAYTRIVFMGTLGNIGYNMNAGILRGMGDSKASLWFLVVSCITNIILDLLFVSVLGMDVSGAALSTTIAVYISWFVSIWYIRHKFKEVNFKILPKKLSGAELKKILSIGLPLGLNNSLFSFGHMVMQVMVNAQGSTFMAGASVAGRVTGLTSIATAGMSAAASTFSGQNYGANDINRLKQGYIKIPALSGAFTLTMALCFISLRMPILRFFTRDAEVLKFASRYVVVQLCGQWMYGVFDGISKIVNGTGKIKYTTLINLLMLWAVRIPSAYLIMKFFDGTYIMLCFPISFFFGMSSMIGYYLFSKDWKRLIKGAE